MTETDWLDPIVTRAIDRQIDKLAKGREHIVNARSRAILNAVVYNTVLDVLAEIVGDPSPLPKEEAHGGGHTD